MKKVLLFTLTIFLLAFTSQAQVVRASMNEDGQIITTTVENEQLPAQARDGLSPMPGFPINFSSNTTYKPMRGVTLADLDGDGADEIIVNFQPDGRRKRLHPRLGDGRHGNN